MLSGLWRIMRTNGFFSDGPVMQRKTGTPTVLAKFTNVANPRLSFLSRKTNQFESLYVWYQQKSHRSLNNRDI